MTRPSLLALFCTLLLPTYSVSARDDSYSGSICTSVFGTRVAGLTRSEFGVQNSADVSTWVTCPIARDNEESQQDAFVTVFADAGTTCFLNMLFVGGVATFQSSATAGGRTEATVIFAETDFRKFSSVVLTCSLPPAAVLGSYHYEEGFDP